MNQLELCQKVYDGELTALEANDLLVPKVDLRRLKRARFVKMRIHLPNESRRLNLFLKVLFGLPIPLSLARFFLRKAGKNALKHPASKPFTDDFSIEELDQLVKYAKGTRVKIEADDAIIRIIIK